VCGRGTAAAQQGGAEAWRRDVDAVAVDAPGGTGTPPRGSRSTSAVLRLCVIYFGRLSMGRTRGCTKWDARHRDESCKKGRWSRGIVTGVYFALFFVLRLGGGTLMYTSNTWLYFSFGQMVLGTG
jgi:hypothetical protein